MNDLTYTGIYRFPQHSVQEQYHTMQPGCSCLHTTAAKRIFVQHQGQWHIQGCPLLPKESLRVQQS